MAPADVVVHGDVQGASTTIVKNHTPSNPVSPLALAQAGTAVVCRSKAWDSKIVTSAWWVHPAQVSKVAPAGETLATGAFLVPCPPLVALIRCCRDSVLPTLLLCQA